MTYSKQHNAIVIRPSKNNTLVHCIDYIKENKKVFKGQNIILNLLSMEVITKKQLDVFLIFLKAYQDNTNSFVVVSKKIMFDDTPDALKLVPTLQEAHDLIELEDIERDLLK